VISRPGQGIGDTRDHAGRHIGDQASIKDQGNPRDQEHIAIQGKDHADRYM